mmetsp:Transcript_32022/g.77806  ORF Transcript_32022/g.77806 Transcript_32022/m.77806 type:complete len:80 (-) Transcript_32022:232-471(-)
MRLELRPLLETQALLSNKSNTVEIERGTRYDSISKSAYYCSANGYPQQLLQLNDLPKPPQSAKVELLRPESERICYTAL